MNYQRLAEVDPDQYSIRAIVERSRVEGESVYLECLADLERWKGSSNIVQDIAAEVVRGRLGDGFEWERTIRWSCFYSDRNYCPDEGVGRKNIAQHRLASFRHKAMFYFAEALLILDLVILRN